MNRDQILAAANACISYERAAVYGDAAINFANIAALWQAYLDGLDGKGLTARDVGMLLALLKIGRAVTSPSHLDNYIDACGYLALVGEIAKAD